MKRTIKLTAQARFNALMGTLETIHAMALSPAFDGQKETAVELNASLITQDSFSKELTVYATGWRDDTDIQRELDFFAPGVEAPRRYEYLENINWEAYLGADPNEDIRAVGADFKEVKYNTKKTLGKLANRGLMMMVDLDEVKEERGWEQKRVAKLMYRLKVNKLRRAIALLSAAAVNTAKTWDTTAGKDPDMDVTTELVTSANISGMKPNRVGYGDTAFTKRMLSHRAQDTAGGFASASLSLDLIAGQLGVEKVLRSNSRYSTTKTAKGEVLGALVLMFTALQNADNEDPSNVKDFWSPTDQGVRFGVHSIPYGVKRHLIAVEHYEDMKLTSNLGIRQFTVS